MAKQTTVTLIDDIDGPEAVKIVNFAIDGAIYEIDLTAKNAKKLRDGIAKFVGNARSAPRAALPLHRPRGLRHSREHLQAVRDWARRSGYELSSRSRIPAAVLEEFDAAH